MTINASEAVLIRNLTRIDVISRYAEAIKYKVEECMAERIQTEPEGEGIGTALHLQAINLIAEDILKLTDTALEDFNNPVVEYKPKTKSK